MKIIDNFLDSITMYRLLLYYLILLLVAAFIFSLFGIISYNPVSIIGSSLFLVAVSWTTNKIFAWAFNAPVNLESVYLSALILALIVSPADSPSGIPLLFWAAVLTQASKYILAINKKHIFNPVAIAVVLTGWGFAGSASWWIGSQAMLPFSLLGLLIVRKIRRFDLVFYFFLASLTTIFIYSVSRGSDTLTTLRQIINSSPLFFFAFIMLTEPLTTPPTKFLQSIYGAFVGILFAPQFHIGSFFTSPELSLVIGNVFSYLVSPKYKILSVIRQKIPLARDMVDFILPRPPKFIFSPGQYMEWTLPHRHPDARGNRRYFTIASSPTENELRLGVKFYPSGSSYKKSMIMIDDKTPISGASLSGDFTLPKDTTKKLVFIAGGIGITPFRSMVKYLIDLKQPRPITLFYANKTADEIVYSDIFNLAGTAIGIKTVYTLTDTTQLPANWTGRVGRINADMISQEVPDFNERTFYLSGPHAMVTSYKETLKSMGIHERQIKTDFFPGFV